MDREGRHKGGIVLLVRNNIPAEYFEIDTNQEAEIHAVKIHVEGKEILIYNIYCPSDKQLSLDSLNIPLDNCIVVGDLNSHSTCWGYNETDGRGEEVEDWMIETKLVLINDPDDPPTFFSRRWRTTSTPDLALATDDISKKLTRAVLNQLGGSDHRPVKLQLDINYKPDDSKTFPRWNYKKAKWPLFAGLTDKYTKNIAVNDRNINRATKQFNDAILKSAKESIPRGARKDYRPYWNLELQGLEEAVSAARSMVEENPSIENNIRYKASEAKYKRSYKDAAKKSWIEKTESLNLDRDGSKLWKLTKALNNESTRTAPILLKQGDKSLTGKQAADCFINTYAEISNTTIPLDREKEVKGQLKELPEQTNVEGMSEPLNMTELNAALKCLSKHKSPGPDEITNEMLQNLGTRAKSKLLGIFNNSWKSGNVPQIWREANMIPIPKKGKNKNDPSSYRPISLTSCVGKLVERIINNRLTWYLEKNEKLVPEQAGFRHSRSTEDQVTYVSQQIEDAYQEKKQTVAVWIDMAKAFDTVWKEGLKLKLKQIGVGSKMLKWIFQYLTNRKARVRTNGSYSRKKILHQGVPQGGVLSPTLFLIFINDIVMSLPRNVRGAMYADDLAIWCSEEFATTAGYRIQQALTLLESWTKEWIININETKTTYTLFSLSPKDPNLSLKIKGKALRHDPNPTYLGITFDKRLTWKPQLDKTEKKAKDRLKLMKKLAGTNWGADAQVLQTLYTGRVRPILEYGIATWGTTAKSNFKKLTRVQNQACRIITGGMKSTPIHQLENHTGLKSLEERHETKTMMQSAKFKRLLDHPMNSRMSQPAKKRLKRESFIHQSKTLERKHDLADQETEKIRCYQATPPWQRQNVPEIRITVPDISKKGCQSDAERRQLTLTYLDSEYPSQEWTRAYTDGSADKAVENGGSGVYIAYPNGEEERISIPAGLVSSNYKAEVTGLKKAIDSLEKNANTSVRTVLLTDALSVLQSLQSGKHRDLDDLVTALTSFSRSHHIILQWIPSHCGVMGNEEADKLAKQGARMPQENIPSTYSESKTIIRSTIHNAWSARHPDYQNSDPYRKLSRSDQVIMFRLRTGHNRLNDHLCAKFKIGTRQCPCTTGNMTVEHILQFCPTYTALRKQHWPEPEALRTKLHGSLEDLLRTAAFVKESGLII